VQHFVLQLDETPARRIALDGHRIEVRLDVQRLDEGVGIEEELKDGVEQAANPADRRAVRFVQRLVVERKVGKRLRALGRFLLPELLEQIGSDAARVEEFLELDGRQLADLLLGVVDAALLTDAGADLLHDLLDVDRVGADVEIRHR
jgi:hypothetical protein